MKQDLEMLLHQLIADKFRQASTENEDDYCHRLGREKPAAAVIEIKTESPEEEEMEMGPEEEEEYSPYPEEDNSQEDLKARIMKMRK